VVQRGSGVDTDGEVLVSEFFVVFASVAVLGFASRAGAVARVRSFPRGDVWRGCTFASALRSFSYYKSESENERESETKENGGGNLLGCEKGSWW
jgi:hypothetical protein